MPQRAPQGFLAITCRKSGSSSANLAADAFRILSSGSMLGAGCERKRGRCQTASASLGATGRDLTWPTPKFTIVSTVGTEYCPY
jgi:hypothetical protein